MCVCDRQPTAAAVENNARAGRIAAVAIA